MARISSVFFMISLLGYYMLKLLNLKRCKVIKFHVITGWISIIIMGLATIMKFGQLDIVKYIVFTIIMITIGITGYLTHKIDIKYKKTHIYSTILFFIYLITIIIY
ncbi:MAG: hypothetical protein ACRC57_04090 [Sarcina sp.]